MLRHRTRFLGVFRNEEAKFTPVFSIKSHRFNTFWESDPKGSNIRAQHISSQLALMCETWWPLWLKTWWPLWASPFRYQPLHLLNRVNPLNPENERTGIQPMYSCTSALKVVLNNYGNFIVKSILYILLNENWTAIAEQIDSVDLNAIASLFKMHAS